MARLPEGRIAKKALLDRLESDPVAMARFVTKMVDVLNEFGVPEDAVTVSIPGVNLGPAAGRDPGDVGVVIISKSDGDKNESSIIIGLKENELIRSRR